MKITKATAEQWERVEKVKQRWLSTEQTTQYDDRTIQTTAKDFLSTLGHNNTPVFVVSGPVQARMMSQVLDSQLGDQLYDQLYAQLDDQLGGQLDSQLRGQLVGQLRRQLRGQLYAQLYAQLRDQLGGQLRDQLYAQLDDQLSGHLRAQLDSHLRGQLRDQLSGQLDDHLRGQLSVQLRDQLSDQLGGQLGGQLVGQLGGQLSGHLRAQLDDQLSGHLRAQLDSHLRAQLDDQLSVQLRAQLDSRKPLNRYVGLWWNAWAGWYEGAETLGVRFDRDELQSFLDWNRHCPVWMWDDYAVYILRRPKKVHFENGVLHNESGPAAEFSRFFNLWSIDGIPVSEQIVMRPDTQTIKDMSEETNSDVKAVRIERYGWTKYIQATNARLSDYRCNDVEGTREALYQTDQGSRLVVTCPTGRVFALGVPESVETCVEAQAWLNGDDSIRVVART